MLGSGVDGRSTPDPPVPGFSPFSRASRGNRTRSGRLWNAHLCEPTAGDLGEGSARAPAKYTLASRNALTNSDQSASGGKTLSDV
jgi:hypothetical protein